MVMRVASGTTRCGLEDPGSSITWEHVRNAESAESEFREWGSETCVCITPNAQLAQEALLVIKCN